jgi:MarR family transcriptional regulator, organic hydroperoxide resistance regulator
MSGMPITSHDTVGALMAASRSPPALEGVLGFLRLLWALDHGMHLCSRRMQQERGITGQQRLVVRILSKSPAMSPSELADALHLHSSTVTGLLKRLERDGFVRRRPDPRDGRRIVVGLTSKGQRTAVPGPHTIEALVAKALAVFPAAKIEAAEELLRTLANVLMRDAER